MTLSAPAASALGLSTGYLADRLFGDPRRGHPVAGFGRTAAALEQASYRDSRAAGAGHALVLIAGAVGAGVGLETLARGSGPGTLSAVRAPSAAGAGTRERVPRAGGWALLAVTAAATWAVLGGRSLSREAQTISAQLAEDDLEAARRQVRNLVGRDPATLDAAGLARAVVESVAENTSDAVVAPLLWGAVAGVPGLLGFRAVNTLDAMIGHRSARYLRFGWAAARLDDLANWVPARVTAALTALASPLLGGAPDAAWAAVRRDAAAHPSPNAGMVEAAFAGGLGVQLGGVNVYGGQAEDRGMLGDGRPVAVADIARATRLAAAVGTASLGLAVALRLTRPTAPTREAARNTRHPRRSAAVVDHCRAAGARR